MQYTFCDDVMRASCLSLEATMKATVMSVLLCLLFAVVEVHSQPVPYITFNGSYVPNNSYVDFNLVWEDNNTYVVCHTDLVTCCSSRQGQDRGDWFFPNGSRLPFPSTDGSATIFEARTYRGAELRRLQNTLQISGIYCCNIETRATRNDSRQSVYIGLYFNGGQFIHKCVQVAPTCSS